jgi:hypothetical protein
VFKDVKDPKPYHPKFWLFTSGTNLIEEEIIEFTHVGFDLLSKDPNTNIFIIHMLKWCGLDYHFWSICKRTKRN